jgi:hypothetical protein
MVGYHLGLRFSSVLSENSRCIRDTHPACKARHIFAMPAQPSEQHPNHVSNKGSRVKKIIMSVVIVAALFTAADFGLAAVAEHKVSQEARERFDLADDPSVTIHGFPFTLQALTGEYGRITVYAAGVPVRDTLRDLELNAELHDVTAPLRDIIDGNTDSMSIGTLEGEVKVKEADVGRFIRLPDLKIEPATEEHVRTGQEPTDLDTEEAIEEHEEEDASAGVRLSANAEIAGTEVEIIAFGMIELDGSTMRIAPQRLELGSDNEDVVVPEPVRNTLLPQFETAIDPGSLPFGVTPTAVRVERGALVIKGEARDVTFAGANGTD